MQQGAFSILNVIKVSGVPEAFQRIHTLGVGLWLLPTENGFRAIQMSSQDTQLILSVAFFLPKIKLSSKRPYACGAQLYAHAFLRTHRYAPEGVHTL